MGGKRKYLVWTSIRLEVDCADVLPRRSPNGCTSGLPRPRSTASIRATRGRHASAKGRAGTRICSVRAMQTATQQMDMTTNDWIDTVTL